MVIKVGINSFGRIGRVIFRTCCKNSELEVSAINDPAIDLDYMCYLIKFDSTHGKFSGTVSQYEGDEIKVNDQYIKVFHHKTPADIPWHTAGVQYVVEASGMFTSVEKASGHLTSRGVRRVVVTAPSTDAPMLILGVNEHTIQPDMKVVSCASSTLYCLASIVKILEDAYGVADGFVTSIHAMTPSLKPMDGLCVRGKHWRDHRSIHQNIIPAATGACRALGKIIPSCKDKLAGLAFRVPVVNGSVLDVTVRLNKNTTIAEISKTIEELNNPLLQNIIQVSNEKVVSSDFAGETHSCVLDLDSSLQIRPNFFKLICWYENEYSYSRRVLDTVSFLERQFQAQFNTSTRIMYLRPSNLQSNSQGNVKKQNVLFCVPNIQNNRPNVKPSLSFDVELPTRQNSIHQLCKPGISKNKESIKSYIDRLKKFKCNENINGNDVLKKHLSEDNAHAAAENCFKKVEKEISEMLHIAEDLLNKTPNKKPQSERKSIKTSEIELENRNIMRRNIIEKISDTLEKIRKIKENKQSTDIIGQQTTSDVIGQERVSLPKHVIHGTTSLNNSHFKLPKSHLHTKTMKSYVAMKKLNTWTNKNYPDFRVNKMNEPFPSEKTNQSSTNDQKYDYPNKVNEDDATTVASIVSEKLENTLKFLNVTEPAEIEVANKLPNNYNGESESNTNNNQNEPQKNAVEKNSVPASVPNIDNDRKAESDAVENSIRQSTEVKETASVYGRIDAKNKNQVDKASKDKNFAGCFSSPMDINSEKSSCGKVSSYTSKNYSSYKNTQDIYDKLDSDSMSDSGSSYRIREKTSQVINITDLTYSLEDLPRLDKICRVLEISDELSDKLFSPLDNENYENTSRGKWSFQDMCERIKFDDFCKELFEKSPS